MTLRDIECALEAQDAQLQAAHREVSDRYGATPIALRQTALQCLHDLCASPGATIGTTTVFGGIHC